MLLRRQREMRQKLIESVATLQELVFDLKSDLKKREEGVVAREAELARAAGEVAERQRHLEALAGELEQQEAELRGLIQEVKNERAALRQRERATANREASRGRPSGTRLSARVVNQAMVQPMARNEAGPPAPQATADAERPAMALPVAGGGEERPIEAEPEPEEILVRMVHSGGEIQTVPARVHFGEGAL